MSININVENIIEAFGKQNRIFYSEAQLQFALAWEIQKETVNKNYNYTVFLEYMSMYYNNKRFYTDIIVMDNCSKDYIAIELKYKTKEYDHNGMILKNQGAEDCGRYDYLWDVKRLELLKHKEAQYTYNNNLKYCEKAYAIMVTNDHLYWTRGRRGTLSESFYIDDSRSIKENNVMNWKETKNWNKSRPGLTFKRSYPNFKWKSYTGDGNFKYLITVIS